MSHFLNIPKGPPCDPKPRFSTELFGQAKYPKRKNIEAWPCYANPVIVAKCSGSNWSSIITNLTRLSLELLSGLKV